MSNDIEALRSHLFDTLAALKDPTNPMDLDRAKTVSAVAQTIINSAKVEVEYAKATGATGSTFLGLALPPPKSTSSSVITPLPNGYRHQIKK